MTEAFHEVGKGRSFGVVLLFLYEYGFEGIRSLVPPKIGTSTFSVVLAGIVTFCSEGQDRKAWSR